MFRSLSRQTRSIVLFSLSLGLTVSIAAQAADGSGQPLTALIAGSGPDLTHNQVAIESNVRYVTRLLPKSSVTRILFADGDLKTKSVLYQGAKGQPEYRAPQVPAIDGSNLVSNYETEMQALTQSRGKSASAPLLLYFTGHGSPSEKYDNNNYDMWNGDELTVQHLAGLLKTLPPAAPVTVIMVQCFSGDFGNLLFQNADPKGGLTDLNLCGFFASIAQRPAAGCTAAVNEADYHDFTGYFFAALSGRNRQGQPVTGADYDHDGRIGMNEAFAYTLIHDDSIDTPVCTSDVFLRRFVTVPKDDFAQSRYSEVQAWASPTQRAALKALSLQLTLKGEDRLAQAMKHLENVNVQSEDIQDIRLIRFVRLAKTVVLAHTLELSSATALKQRYAVLLAAEAGNLLHS